jgi:DNA polymerase-3 subunit epsilon
VRLADCEYVVVDCETTGFHPSAHHRIIELALVPMDGRGGYGNPWSTLVNPSRDLGATDVHGIRGRDLEDAPTFEAVLGEVVDRLAGRVVVAHNARFDCAFLEHELARAGIYVAPLPALCTMQVAGLLGVGGSRARLADCCAAVGRSHENPHEAEADALACAAVFDAFLAVLRERGITELAELGCSAPPPATVWPLDAPRAPSKQRAPRFGERSEPGFLAKLVHAADAPAGSDAALVAPYLDILDHALEDRRLSPQEQDELAAIALMLGLDATRVRVLHSDYVCTLVALAYRDGVVTSREREDLDLVADALGVVGVEEALARIEASRPSLAPSAPTTPLAGKTVCFTGALSCEYEGVPITRERAEELASRAGMIVMPRVTKGLDLLVVADPHSMSGKARKAREYGTRVVAETAFWPMIGVDVA